MLKGTICFQEAEAAYESWERGESQGVSPEVLMYAVQELDKGEEIWEKLQKSPHPGNEPLYQALASSKESNMIKKLLQGFRTLQNLLAMDQIPSKY